MDDLEAMQAAAAEREKVIARVRKLLALAGNNPNEHEAASAAERAQAILAEYNLSLSEVQAAEGQENRFEFDATARTDSRPWRRQLAMMIAQLYFCKYFFTFVKVSTSKRKNGYIRHDVHNFVGAKHNLMVARMIFDYLNETVTRLAKEESTAYPMKERTAFITSFQHTCSMRLCVRIQQRIEDAKAGKVKAETSTGAPGTALVLAGLYEETQKKIEDFLKKEVGAMRSHKPRSQITHTGGALAGRAAGDRISLDAQVAGKGNQQRIGR